MLHNCILHSDSESILAELNQIGLLTVLVVVMEDVVEGQRVQRSQQLLLHVSSLLLQVLSSCSDLFDLLMG